MSQLYPAFVLTRNHLPQILQTGFNSVKLPDTAPLFTLPCIPPYDIAITALQYVLTVTPQPQAWTIDHCCMKS